MSRFVRFRRPLAVALSFLLVGCSAATSSTDRAGEVPPDLASFYDQTLDYGACTGYARTDVDAKLFANEQLQCARLTVPLDYGNPKRRTIELGVLKVAATGQPQGSLVVNPGGPASSGMSFAAQLKSTRGYPRIAQQFDVVGFDMRGTGASTPSVDCLTDAERRNDVLMAINLFGGETWTEDETRRVAASCAAGSGGADVISHLGSRDTVRDMDVLRAVLGDEQLNYFGFSYGTRLGAVYAATFPGKVRTMVLDGAMDPNLGIEKRMVDQYAGFQQAFEAFATDCARAASCPLGTDPAKATTRFQQLVRPLVDRPPAVGPDRRLTYRGAVEAVLFALYRSSYWPTIVKALTQLAAGQGNLVLAIRDGAHELQSDGRYTNMLEGALATHCNDRERLSPQRETAMRRRMLTAAPFLDDGRNRQARDICEHWPARPSLTYPYVTDTDGLPPTLVVSVTGDPASPHQHGIGLAKTLGASLLTVEGQQHGAALVAGNDCVDTIVTTYLIDAKAAPADAHCAL